MQIVTAKRTHLGQLGPQKGLFSVVTCSQPDWPNPGAQDPLPLEPQFASGRVPGMGRVSCLGCRTGARLVRVWGPLGLPQLPLVKGQHVDAQQQVGYRMGCHAIPNVLGAY